MNYLFMTLAMALAAAALTACSPPPAKTANTADSAYHPPRDTYGQPDLNGIWQAIGSAHRDVEAHEARMGPLVEMGALGAVPAGLGVVVDGPIPYQPWAREQQQQNLADSLARDPALKCFLPGVPRANYQPHPFQIVQGSDTTMLIYEFASASRLVYMNRPDFENEFESWMGHSRGRWEGDTLVVDVTSQMPDTWFDGSGNFHSEALRVEERFTPVSENLLRYEATIDDPKVFTRPWKISMPLYRRMEENAQLLEFKCVEFAEELMYGHLVKKPAES
jgi:hypothetical protein